MTLASIFAINQNVIKEHNDENNKLFSYDFVDVALEAGGSVGKIKKYDLVLEITVPRLEGCFPFVPLPNSYLIIFIYQFQLSKILDITQAIEQRTNQG